MEGFYMIKRRRVMAVITSSILMISATSVNYSSAATDIIPSETKLDEKLIEVMESSSDSELIPVGVKLKDLDWSVIDKMIEKNSDFKVTDYLDINTYSRGIMLDIIRETEEKYGFEKAHITPLRNPETGEFTFESDIYYDFSSEKSKLLSEMSYKERSEYLNSKVSDSEKKELAEITPGMSLITKKISDDIDDYMAVRRECVTKAYKAYNHNFIDDYINDEHIITNTGFAPYLIVEANKSQISKLCNDVFVDQLSFELTKVGMISMYDSQNVTNAAVVRDNNNYTGSGVKVGVLEFANGRYDSNYIMLNGCQRLNYVFLGTDVGIINTHATIVTSIIKGKAVHSDGVTYCGVVPDARVYQQCDNDAYSLTDNIENLISNGVSIINLSGGYHYYEDTNHQNLAACNSAYNNEDWLVDNAINNYGIVFVNSAGNTSDYISSPGKAYNAITVGNCNASTNTISPYLMAGSSSFREDDGLANKPEIVAPGTDIKFPNINTTYSGTSLSAPIVSGVAAQMIQCDPTLKLPSASQSAFGGKTYYNTVKALILLGADYQSISSTNNISKTHGSTPASLYRDKSGAGLIDAKKTIDIILGNGYSTHRTNINMNPNGTSEDGMNSYLSYRTGDKIRAVLCYSKINRNSNLDLDLFIYNSNMAHQIYSDSSYNNTEIVEYTIPSNGRYIVSANWYQNSNQSMTSGQQLPGALVYYVER